MIEIDQSIALKIQDTLHNNLVLFVRDALYVDYRTKFACIYADVDQKRPEEYLYTVQTAEILQAITTIRVIAGWSYVPRHSPLDALVIDFVVLKRNREIIGVESTSSEREATRHRQKMRKVYPASTDEHPAVAVVRWRTKFGFDRKVTDVRLDLVRQLVIVRPLAILGDASTT